MTFAVGDRVWWHVTTENVLRGTIVELEERPGVKPDHDPDLLYLDADQLHPQEPGVFADIPEAAYHSDRGSLSHSAAKLLLPPSCPAKFRHIMDTPRTPKNAFDFGHVAHKLVLGKGSDFMALYPNVHGLKKDGAPADNPTATTAWKKAEEFARQSGKVPIHIDQLTAAEAMCDTLREHPVAGPLFSRGDAELSVYAKHPDGVMLRARFDWLTRWEGRLTIVDYKTCADASPIELPRAVAKWRYALQCAWYVTLAQLAGVGDKPVFLMCFQEKQPPYLVNVVELDDEAFHEGRRQMQQAISLYADCKKSGIWPGYPEGINPVSLPLWAVAIDDEMEFSA